MKRLVEKAGMCWHETSYNIHNTRFMCSCSRGGLSMDYWHEHKNPSKDSLADLIHLAENLIDLHVLAFSYGDVVTVNIIGNNGIKYIDTWFDGEDKVQALFGALLKSQGME